MKEIDTDKFQAIYKKITNNQKIIPKQENTINLTDIQEDEKQYAKIIQDIIEILNSYTKKYYFTCLCNGHDILFPIFLELVTNEDQDKVLQLDKALQLLNLNDDLVETKQPYTNVLFHIIDMQENEITINNTVDFKQEINKYYGRIVYKLEPSIDTQEDKFLKQLSNEIEKKE